MRGVYEAVVKISGLTAGKTLMYLTAPANKCVELLSAAVTNCSNETNEQIEIAIQRVNSLGTPTATTLTPSQMEPGDQAAGSTVKGNVTGSEPTYVSNTEIGYEGAPSLGGWRFQPSPEERPIVPGGATIGIRHLAAISAADVIVTLRFREIG